MSISDIPTDILCTILNNNCEILHNLKCVNKYLRDTTVTVPLYKDILISSREFHQKRVEQHKTILAIRLKLQTNDLVSGCQYALMILESKNNIKKHLNIYNKLQNMCKKYSKMLS